MQQTQTHVPPRVQSPAGKKHIPAEATLPGKRNIFTGENHIRSAYFFYYFAMAGAIPFIAPFYKEYCRFSDHQLGFLLSISPAISMLFQPLWSLIADKTGNRPLIASLLIFFSACTFPLYLTTSAFWVIALITATHSLFYSATLSMNDSVTLSFLGEKRRLSFSKLRVWGTVGYMISAPIAGFIFDLKGLRWMFLLFPITMIVAGIVMLKVPSHGTNAGAHLKEAIKYFIRKPNVILFLSISLFSSLSMGMAGMFLFVYAKELGANNSQIGWMTVASTAAETLFMPFIGSIARRIGVRKIIAIGMACMFIRWVPLYFVHAWWQIIPFQLLHPVTYIIIYIGSALFMDMEAPSGLRSSAQALYAVLVGNIGGLIAASLGGILASSFGYSSIYIVSGTLPLVASVMILFFVNEPRHSIPSETGNTATAQLK